MFQNKASIAKSEKDLNKIEANVEKMRSEKKDAEEEYEASKKHYQAVSAGLSSNDDGEAATLKDQLISKFPTIIHPSIIHHIMLVMTVDVTSYKTSLIFSYLDKNNLIMQIKWNSPW